jgi:hypothetical protein
MEAETLSERELLQRVARKGMRICAWILLITLLCINYNWVLAIWRLAAHAWPKI